MNYREDGARIAQQAADDYPGEEARDDRYRFIEQEVAKIFPLKAPAHLYWRRTIRADIQDAIERLLEENEE